MGDGRAINALAEELAVTEENRPCSNRQELHLQNC